MAFGLAQCWLAGALLRCLDLGMVPRGPSAGVGFGAHGHPCIRWYGYAMRLGKGLLSAIKRGGQGAGLLAVTLGAAMGLSGMGAILRFAQDVELRIAGRSDNYKALLQRSQWPHPAPESGILKVNSLTKWFLR